jgi:serine/threonine protein kinase
VIYRKNNELGLVAVLELQGTQYIGKLISLSKQNAAISEIYFLNRLKGESICNLVDVVKTPSGIWIIMEKGWKSLLEYNVKSQEVETVLKNIASAYIHFYKDNIAHRDIKLNNIVIEQDLRVRFIDLELC